MWTKRLQTMIEKNRHEVQGLLLRRYPAYVWSDRATDLAAIPAFVFHDVTAAALTPLLQFLADNRYATLTADEYVERRHHGASDRERAVLLTFDDGLKSLYTEAFPVLKRFGAKAVAYVVPGMVPHSTGEDVLERALCHWSELLEMHQSGLVDIQSHSMYHHSIPASARVIDFAKPSSPLTFLESRLAPLMHEAGRVRKSHELPYGAPLYDWAPRFGARPAFRDNPDVRMECTQYVDSQGGAAFFQAPHWRERLEALVKAAQRQHDDGGIETEAEQRQAILADLRDSRHALEQRLPGHTVRHFCFPWFQGSPLAVQLSAAAGYMTNAWGSLLPDFVRSDQSPIPVARLSPPYLWRLPGKGRKPIGRILQMRLSRAVHP
jgi:hypothetical protein